MHGTFFDIGLGTGLAVACGLRPYLPAMLAGLLGSAGALDVSFGHGHFHFLQATWWLFVLLVVLIASYAVQLRTTVERFDPIAGPTVTGQAIAIGALLFAGVLSAAGDVWWPGLLGGAAATLVARFAVLPVMRGARARLPDRNAREALTVYLDSAALLLAALVALLHPLGYVALGVLAWFAWRGRSRSDQKYAGLRILRS